MRGMYLNCDDGKLPASSALADKYSHEFLFPATLGEGKVVYDLNEWPLPPIYKNNDNIFIVTGWFIYKGQRNNLSQLADDILSIGIDTVNLVEVGSFVLYWWDGTTPRIIVDPMGLSTHYVDHLADELTIAPSVKALFRENTHKQSTIMTSILSKKNHLIGNFTLFDGIERLSPGSMLSTVKSQQYTTISCESKDDYSTLGAVIADIGTYWDDSKKILPLSAGLDSRFLLANTTFKNGFTYGPKNSPEVNITAQFANEFSDYYSFDFCQEPLAVNEEDILNEIAFGVVKPIPRLLSNYLHVKDRFQAAHVFFEGYLGDVFQRGTFITFKGVLGEIFKIFPLVYKVKKFDGITLLRLRYKELNEKELELLVNDFIEKTRDLAFDDYQKVTYYEFLFGRGGRYAVFGSNILAAQVFTVVSPFTHKKIFNALIHQDFSDAVSYRTMKKLWSTAKSKYTRAKVESGYSPGSSPVVIPFIQIIYRLMFHFIPSRANYGVQLNRSNTKKDKGV